MSGLPTFNTQVMIGNWVEDRANREGVIEAYVEIKRAADIRTDQKLLDLRNISDPV